MLGPIFVSLVLCWMEKNWRRVRSTELPGGTFTAGSSRVAIRLSGGDVLELSSTCFRICNHQWIGLRENLQETIDFPIKYGAFLYVIFPLNQSIETTIVRLFSPKIQAFWNAMNHNTGSLNYLLHIFGSIAWVLDFLTWLEVSIQALLLIDRPSYGGMTGEWCSPENCYDVVGTLIVAPTGSDKNQLPSGYD